MVEDRPAGAPSAAPAGQSAEIDLLEEDLAAAAAAAAMSMVLFDEDALALEVALVRLGAMAYERNVRSEKEVLRGKETGAREKRNLGMKGTGEVLVLTLSNL